MKRRRRLKKPIRVFMYASILCFVLAYVLFVDVNANIKDKVIISQGDVFLEGNDNVFTAVNSKNLLLELDVDAEYLIKGLTSDEYISSSDSYDIDFGSHDVDICVSFEYIDEQYVCYDTINYKFDVVHNFDESKIFNGSIELVRAVQNDNVLSSDDGIFYVTSDKDITIDLIGNDLDDDTEYTFFYNTYKGSEINKGITVNLPISLYENSTSFGFFVELFDEVSPIVMDQNDVIFVLQDVDLTYQSSFNDNIEILSNNKFAINSENLSDDFNINVFGNSFISIDYNLELSVLKNGEKIFESTSLYHGSELNDGISISLLDLELSQSKHFNESYFDIDNDYVVVLSLGGTTNYYDFYIVNSGSVDVSFYNDEGSKLDFSSNVLDEMIYGNTSNFNFSSDIISSKKSNYLYFTGDDFNDSLNYDYVLAYKDGDVYQNIVTGNVSGLSMNNKGIFLDISDYKIKDNRVYKLTVLLDDKIVTQNIINIVESSSVSFSSPVITDSSGCEFFNNILSGDVLEFLVYGDNDLSLSLSASNFVASESYLVRINVYDENNNSLKTIDSNYLGSELNENNLVIEIKNDEYKGNDNISIVVDVLDQSYLQTFYITFVNENDFFVENDIFNIESGYLSDIESGTLILDFIKSNLKGNYTLEVYDVAGNLATSSILKTGQLACVVDTFGNCVYSISLVVTGDVTGDGYISITDLVKVSRDVAQLEILSGAYSKAGDITKTGYIGITDLVKIVQSVSNYEGGIN